MLRQIETNKDRVRAILRFYPQTRDDDTALYFMYAKLRTKIMDFGVLTPNQFVNKVVVSAIPPSESLSRARRLIQNVEGLYHGARQKKRMEAAANVRVAIAKI